jgi:uncharacterized tellurite resistance protein B-like protein
VDDEKHPALQLPSEERAAYLRIVASLAAADGVVSDAEIAHLRGACGDLGLSEAEIGTVIAAAEEPDQAKLDEDLRLLRGSTLKFTLLSDLLFIAHADDTYSEEERNEVFAIGDALGINEGQRLAVNRYVAAMLKANRARGFEADDLKKLGGEVAAGLAATGVPIAAVAASGSVAGLSTAGITSGLAALGMGLGVTTGIGVVVGIGVASYFGVRWLAKKVTTESDNGR